MKAFDLCQGKLPGSNIILDKKNLTGDIMSEIKIKTLDVRPIVAREKHPSIFAMFDSLLSGQAMQLVNDHDPKPLYYQMQAENNGQFEWEYIEQGPDVWKVNIKKV